MAYGLDEIGEQASEIGSTALTWGLIIVGGVIVIAIIWLIIWWLLRRKRWNLIVEIKMPRSDGQVILRERAKGHYDIKAGIVDIKRKRLKAVGMKPFEVQKFLQGSKYLEVIQLSPTDYIPSLPKSYTIVTDKDGKKYATLEIGTNLEKRRTWKNYMERSAKDRFTIVGFLDKHWRAIEMSIIVFMIFLGFTIVIIRLPSVCG